MRNQRYSQVSNINNKNTGILIALTMKTSAKQTLNQQQSVFTQSSRRVAGFTLIEMIVTVTIAAILASIAIPSFTKMIERNRISTGTNEFLSALILARSEAVKRSTTVVVCASTNQTSCAVGETNFSKGWIIFPECNSSAIGGANEVNGVIDTTINCDSDGNNVLDSSEQQQIIKVHEALPQLSIASGTDHISFDPSGRSTTMTITIGKDASTPSKQIDIRRTGRVKSCKAGTTGGC